MARAVVIWDDIALGEDGQKVEADKTVSFSIGNRHFELDLSAEHVAEFEADMSRWVKHAHRPDGTPAKLGQAAGTTLVMPSPLTKADLDFLTVPGRNPEWYYAEMRRFAGEQNPRIEVPYDGGKYEYPMDLRRKWDMHLIELVSKAAA